MPPFRAGEATSHNHGTVCPTAHVDAVKIDLYHNLDDVNLTIGNLRVAIDLALAILHHLLIFVLAGTLAAELALVRRGLDIRLLPLLGRLDRAYGALAGIVVLVGIGRVIFGLKGWEYYVWYWAFWAKMLAFATTGLLSALPTRRIIRWRRAATTDAGFSIPAQEIEAVRLYLWAQVVFFALILVFAATMARGIGY